MPSSTSSSNLSMNRDKHSRVILLGLVVGILMTLLVENLLRYKGATPNVRDTPELWASQRAKASTLGKEALILVGSSRIQLDLDLDLLAKATAMQPVQLAIDGSPYLEILENLANDKSVTGTVLISASFEKFFPGNNGVRVNRWIAVYEKEFRGLWSPAQEQIIKAKLQSASALYANIIPLDRLLALLMSKEKLRKPYLKTLPSRERSADYSLVKMPDFYISRVRRGLGYPLPENSYASYESFGEAVVSVAKDKKKEYKFDPKRLQRLKIAIRKLQNRSVDIIFARFPVSGLIEAIKDIRHPESHWQQVIAELGVKFINYKDYPELMYQLPDGSHLDQSQKPKFTLDFSRIFLETKAR